MFVRGRAGAGGGILNVLSVIAVNCGSFSDRSLWAGAGARRTSSRKSYLSSSAPMKAARVSVGQGADSRGKRMEVGSYFVLAHAPHVFVCGVGSTTIGKRALY